MQLSEITQQSKLELYNRYISNGWIEKHSSGCWLWKGKLDHGYARITSVRTSVHRLSYEAHKGSVPDELNVLHKCNVKHCSNPDHLYAGTQVDNLVDASFRKQLNQEKRAFSDEEELAIRQRYESGETQRGIANSLSVTQSTISLVVNRRKPMQLKNLVTTIEQMSDEQLHEHVRAMRHRREVVRPAAKRIVEKAVKKTRTARDKKLDASVAALSDEDRAKLIALLGG